MLTSTQKWHSLNDAMEAGVREREREAEQLKSQHEQLRQQLTTDIDDLVRIYFTLVLGI